MQVFDADQTQALTRAFDRAWDGILRERGLKLADIASARELMAKQIVLLAKAGERDEARLARAAVMRFRTQRTAEQCMRNALDSGSTAVSS